MRDLVRSALCWHNQGQAQAAGTPVRRPACRGIFPSGLLPPTAQGPPGWEPPELWREGLCWRNKTLRKRKAQMGER